MMWMCPPEDRQLSGGQARGPEVTAVRLEGEGSTKHMLEGDGAALWGFRLS